MTNEEIQKRVNNLDAWVAHFKVGIDQLRDLVVHRRTVAAIPDPDLQRMSRDELLDKLHNLISDLDDKALAGVVFYLKSNRNRR